MDFSVIFDMDGVIVDTNPYHVAAWQKFCVDHRIELSPAVMKESIFGRTSNDALSFLFGNDLEPALRDLFAHEINGSFRSLYLPHIKPVKGLVDFLFSLRQAGISCAIATSAPTVNVDFVLHHTGLRKYFDVIVDVNFISKSKPDPEIYLTAASFLRRDPVDCIVFEDSISGVTAAKRAGMKVIGLTTTHSPEELEQTDLTIPDFSLIKVSELYQLVRSIPV